MQHRQLEQRIKVNEHFVQQLPLSNAAKTENESSDSVAIAHEFFSISFCEKH